MKTKIIEAQEPTKSWWGKFLIGQFEKEWGRLGKVQELEQYPLLRHLGWGPQHTLVVDLSVGHGVVLNINPSASPAYDLEKRGIYFCPLMLPFLEWFYTEGSDKKLEDLPDLVEVRSPKVGWLGPTAGIIPPYSRV